MLLYKVLELPGMMDINYTSNNHVLKSCARLVQMHTLHWHKQNFVEISICRQFVYLLEKLFEYSPYKWPSQCLVFLLAMYVWLWRRFIYIVLFSNYLHLKILAFQTIGWINVNIDFSRISAFEINMKLFHLSYFRAKTKYCIRKKILVNFI